MSTHHQQKVENTPDQDQDPHAGVRVDNVDDESNDDQDGEDTTTDEELSSLRNGEIVGQKGGRIRSEA